MPTLDLQTSDWLSTAIEQGYQDLSELYGYPFEIVHRMPVCRKMAAMTVYRLLFDHDFDAATTDERPAWRVDGHGYLVFPQNDIEIIADPTWQQFLGAADLDPNLPKALVGPRDEVATRACLAGVALFNLPLWESSGFYESPQAIMSRHPSAHRLPTNS